MSPLVGGILIGVGGIIALFIFWRLLKSFYNIFFPYVLLRPINLRKRAGANWVVVTGATDGIGKGYCFELASRGFNIFLVSRTQSKLDATKIELLEKYPRIEVRTASFDFTNTSVVDYQSLLKTLNQVDIGILVNNVGMAYEYPDYMHNIDFKTTCNVTIVNTLPPTLLTVGIIPQMLARKTGIIINLGSSAGLSQMAQWAVYSATKKYVSWLGAILRKEYGHQGITIQTITPMLVSTNMTANVETSFLVPDVTKFVKSALKTVGNVSETTGYIGHQTAAEIASFFPEAVLDKIAERTTAQLKAAAMAKRENDQRLFSKPNNQYP